MKEFYYMKKIIIAFGVVTLFGQVNAGDFFSSRRVVDKIVARVNGANILKSDLIKPRISKSGGGYTLEEMVTEELFCQKSAERKLLPTELGVERQIVSLKIHNNLTDLSDKQFEEELKSEGFSLKEYKSQLGRMLASEKLRRAEFSERIVVTSQDVEDYYKKHPAWGQEEYLLKMCELPKDAVGDAGKLIKKDNLKWDDLGWVAKVDLSSSLSFVSNLKKGETSEPIKIDSGFQLIKIEDKKEERLKNLDERYIEIERMLQNQKQEKFEKEFESELREKASIVYLD